MFTAIAGCAAALTGLLFVAISVSPGRRATAQPSVIQEVRASSSILAFVNVLAVSLFGLVPNTNAGYPAVVMALGGIFFTAAAIRSILTSPAARRQFRRQLGLITLLLATFGFECAAGIELLRPGHERDPLALAVLSYVLAAAVLIGVARAWELVGDRDTGIFYSIAVLTRGLGPHRDGHPGGPGAGEAAPSAQVLVPGPQSAVQPSGAGRDSGLPAQGPGAEVPDESGAPSRGPGRTESTESPESTAE
ncbi:MAG: hypothetical protein ACLPUO_03760 [Streptosporangiaceae bacterium]|jgi:hypothetical protein